MKKILFAVCVVLTMGSCYNDKYDELYPTPATAVNLCDTATNAAKFSVSVNSIITTKCGSTGCHNAATAQSGYILTNHANDSAATDRIMARVQANTMPPSTSPQLTDCEKGQLLNWLNHGAPNN